MKRLVLVILVASVGWAMFWVVQAWNLKSDLAAWFEDRAADGWEASYGDLQVRGFPSRLDATLTDVKLFDPARGTGWDAPFFQILGLSYKPGHVILIWPKTQTLTLPSGHHDITSDGLRASLVFDADGRILRSNLEAETLNVAAPGRALALAGLRVGMQLLTVENNDYRFGLHADAIARPDNRDGISQTEALDVLSEVRFDRSWHVGALGEASPQPRMVALRQAAYRNNRLELDLAGQLDIDEAGRADGALTLRAKNWREMLDAAKRSGTLPPALADTLEQGLSLASGLSGRRDTLDLPLRFSNGDVSLGIIPLGEAPRLRLP